MLGFLNYAKNYASIVDKSLTTYMERKYKMPICGQIFYSWMIVLDLGIEHKFLLDSADRVFINY